MRRCEDELFQELSASCKNSEMDALRTKVALLEEHAKRQQQWLEDLPVLLLLEALLLWVEPALYRMLPE